MILAILSAVAIVAGGTAAVWHLVPARCLPSRCLALGLGAGLGCGLASCLTFVISWLLGGLSRAALTLELVLVLGALLVLVLRHPKSLQVAEVEHGGVATARLHGAVLFVGACLALVIGGSRFTLLAWMWPHGQWDAWAIWNLRARFLARALGDWSSAFRIAEGHPHYLGSFGHPDYPLLLPLTIARAWVWSGTEATGVPRLVAATFLAATVVVLMAGLATLRGASCAALGGVVLLALPGLVSLSAWQYADVPVAFYFLATIVALALARRTPEDPRGLVLAGLLAGLAAWTKNEGWLFVVVVVIVSIAMGSWRAGVRGAFGDGRALLAGLLPVVAIVLWFKGTLAPPNDLIASQSLGDALRKLITLNRHGEVLRAFVAGATQVAGPLVWCLPLYAALCGLSRSRHAVAVAVSGGAIVALTALGYHFVYVCTPMDLTWHLDQSLARLLTQLAPATVFAVWMGLRGPGEERRARADD